MVTRAREFVCICLRGLKMTVTVTGTRGITTEKPNKRSNLFQAKTAFKR